MTILLDDTPMCLCIRDQDDDIIAVGDTVLSDATDILKDEGKPSYSFSLLPISLELH